MDNNTKVFNYFKDKYLIGSWLLIINGQFGGISTDPSTLFLRYNKIIESDNNYLIKQIK